MIVVPNVSEEIALDLWLADTLTLKLYSNNHTPGESTTLGSLTEVIGGGYIATSLLPGTWTKNAGVGIYTPINYTFTGPTNAPGTIYGYYVVDSDGALRWVERFQESVLPFTAALGKQIRITPRFQAA